MRSREKRLATLVTMHAYSRPAGSDVEQAFRERWLLNLPDAVEDRHGNIHVAIGTDPTILWSSHTDTVADMAGSQRVHLNGSGVLSLRTPFLKGETQLDRPVLGADDTAGVFLMREMILAGVPGRYVFHYGEECGGIGSSALVAEAPVWLDSIRMAIAFDRQGRNDVVTMQMGTDTCSLVFAHALADLLHETDRRLEYKPARGLYTDTAEYAGLVPECTNLSVGYAHAHTSLEVLDTNHVLRLLDAVICANFETLPIMREPIDPYTYAAVLEWQDDPPVSEAARVLQLDSYWQRPWERDKREQDLYLDPAFADVQAALRRYKM